MMRRAGALLVAAVTAAVVLVAVPPAAPVDALTLTVPNLQYDMLLNDAIGDPDGEVFYATTKTDSPDRPNHILVFDLDSGEVLRSSAFDGEPGSLGISADGSALYVGNNTTGALQKLTLPSFAVEWSVTIPRRHQSYVDVPEDIEVSPIDADVVVASFRTPGLSPGHAGVVVATDGAVLPNRTGDHTGPNRIEFTDDPTKLVGYYNNSTAFSFWHLQIDAEGVTTQPDPNQVTSGFGTDIEYIDGIVVSSAGDIIDPGPPAMRVDEFAAPLLRRRSGMAIDPVASLAYVVEQQTAGTWDNLLSVHDIATGDRVGYLDIPEPAGGSSVYEELRHVGNGVIVLIRQQETRLLYPSIIGGAFGEYTPLDPERVVDSRKDIGRTGGPLRQGETFDMQIAGRGGVPESGVIAVVLNVTAAAPTADGYFTLFPTGIDKPDNSNVNFPAGRDVPNLVTVRLGTNGQVSIFNNRGNVELIVDVAGFYSSGNGPQGSRYQPVEPDRIADTRFGTGGVPIAKIGPRATLPVKVTGRAGVPLDATAVAINVTTTLSSGTSHLRVYPNDIDLPGASNLNFGAEGSTANQVIVRVPASGIVNVYNRAGSTDIIVDIVGYYEDDQTRLDGRFVPINPYRMLNTRESSPFPPPGKLFAGEVIYYDPLSDPESALAINITVTETVGGGHVRAFPHPGEVTNTSSINYETGQTVANHAIIPVDPSFAFQNFGGQTHLIIDVFGYFT